MRKLVFLSLLLFFITKLSAQTITGTLSFCQGLSTTITVTGAPGGSTYQWQRSTDGGVTWINISPGGTGISYPVNIAASYRVLVTGSPTAQVDVVQNPNPIADFTFTNNLCSGTSVQFTSSVSNGTAPYTYSWNFGDAGTSTAQDPAHSYNSLGCGTAVFNVTLTVTDANGCIKAVTKQISVKQAPDVQIKDQNFNLFSNCNNNPTPANPNYTLTIVNNSPSQVCISSYSIDWGDGTAVQNNISFPLSHTYTQLGAFNLVISALGTNNCSNAKTYLVANQSNPGAGLATIPNTTTGLCAPADVPLLITDWKDNSPGTTYILNFGDGTSITLTHPLKADLTTDTIYHTYATSSCPALTFTATLQVTNGCGTSPYSAGNIQVRIKPTASFTAAASICVGQSSCFTNTSVGGTGNNCLNATNNTWDFGDGTPISTLTSPCHIYTAVGTYTVTLSAASPCGTSTFTKQICVTGPATSTFTIDNTTGCIPLPVNATNTSNTITNCVPATYLWTVAYASANCGTSSQWSFTNGTNAASVSPSFIFTNPGTYTITLAVTNGCGTVTSNKTITVKKPPIVSVAAIASFCAPATINPSGTVTNCGTTAATYSWSFPGGSPNTSTTLNPGPVLYNTAGTYIISLTATNECGSTTATQQVIIKDPPAAPTAGSNSPQCSGSTLNLTSITTSAGVAYAWTGPAGYTSTAQNPIRLNATIAMSGNYTVNVSLNGCTSSATTTVLINQTPAILSVTTPVNYCQNALAVPLTATPLAGNTLNWYTVAAGGIASTIAPTPVTTVVGATTYYVSQVTTASNCESARVPIVVNVKPVPVINGNSADPTSCTTSNGIITITGLTINTSYTVQYTKNGTPVTVTLPSNGSGIINIAGLSSGSYTNISVTLNGCTSNVIGPFTLTDPLAPATPTAGSNGPLCSGGTLNLTSNSATTGVTYSWSGPLGFSSTLQNPSRVNATTAMSGTYIVIAKLNGCNSTPATIDVLVDQSPAAPIAGTPVNYCQNAPSVPLTATASAGNTLNWYTVASGGTPDPNAPTPVTAIPGATTYYVSQVSALSNCESVRAAIIVNIKPVPVISGTSSNPTGCSSSNGTITLTGLTPNAAHSVEYTKDAGAPTTLVLTSGNTGIITIPNLPGGTYTNITATLNGCISNSIGPFTLVSFSAPTAPTAGANSPICSGSTLNLTSISTTPGVTYTWTGPGLYSSTLQNPVRPNATTAMSGNYSVTVTLNVCTSVPAIINVVINQTPSTPTSGSNSPLCEGSTLNLNSNTTTPGATYSWIGPNGFSISVQNPSITNITTAGSGTYTVTATLANCPSLPTNTNVVVNPTPAIISSNATDPFGCSAPNGTITLSGMIPNTAYIVQYTRNGGAPTALALTSGVNGVITIVNLTGGTYSNIFVTLNGCSSNTAGPFILITPVPPAAPTAGSNSPLCSGSTLSLTSNSPSAGPVYTWTGPGGFTSNQQNPVITNVSTAMSGAYNVTVTSNGCTSAPATINAIINQSPSAPNAGSNSPLCAGSTLNFNSNTNIPGAAFSWTGPNGFTSNLQNPSILTVTTSANGSYAVFATQGSCSSPVTNILVIINPAPTISGSSYTDPVNCVSITGTIILNGLTPNTIYAAQYTKNGGQPVTVVGLLSTGNGVVTLTNLPGGTYSNISVTLNGCSSNIAGPFTLAQSVPLPATPVASGNSPICVGSTLILNATSASPGVAYTWTGPNGFTSSLQNPIIDTITPASNGKYFVSTKVNGCTSLSDSVNVLVGGYPLVNLGPDLILQAGLQHVMNAAILNAPGAVYLWSPVTNLSCSNCRTPTATIYNDIAYKLQVTNVYGCVSSDTINIKVICDEQNVWIPNAFTPNDDGLNEIFGIRSAGTVLINYFRIFDRTGEMVYEMINGSTNNGGWDGKYKGKLQTKGIYVYTAKLQCAGGNTFFKKGIVLLGKR